MARPDADWLETSVISKALTALPDGSWNEYQVSAAQIAVKLKPYGVRPKQRKMQGGKVLRGYFRAAVLDLASRYGGSQYLHSAATAATPATTPAASASSEVLGEPHIGQDSGGSTGSGEDGDGAEGPSLLGPIRPTDFPKKGEALQ